ncbi:MAG: hypothetical protein IJ773_14570 [Lachnospiraceae bacterium]|nr:hypothetical protein [Lachnospiraceae bacterium]
MVDFTGIRLEPEFSELGVDCYRLEGGNFENPYYIVSEADTRRLLNKPEVVGFDVYHCLLKSTARMMKLFKTQEKISTANILSILRGALNYPLEESCYMEKIRVHDISFLSSERVFQNDEIAGLEIKYSKLATVPDSTLLIGDIIASGETLVHCLRYVIRHYLAGGARLRNIIVFTIGGSTGIEVMEMLTKEIRGYWPEFEGFIGVFYEGVFNTYEDKGVTGIQIPKVDFYWKGGAVAPAYREQTLAQGNALFEKCTIYDGGARRYEIGDHVQEVMEYWHEIRDLAEQIPMKDLLDEKLGYEGQISFDKWREVCHYQDLPAADMRAIYEQEMEFRAGLEDMTLDRIAKARLEEIHRALKRYMLG